MPDEKLTRQMAEDLAIAFGGNDPALRWVDRRLADGPLRARRPHEGGSTRHVEAGSVQEFLTTPEAKRWADALEVLSEGRIYTTSYEALADGQWFSADGGDTWHVCAVPLFGNVAVYCTDQRGADAPTIRVDVSDVVLAREA